MEFHLYGNLDELLLTIDNILVSSLIHVEHQASVGNFCKHYLHVPFMKYMFGVRSDFLQVHVHLVKVAAVNLRKLVLLPLESSQVSHAYVRSILWSGDLQPSFYMNP